MESLASIPKIAPKRKAVSSRRSWTLREEQILIAALKDCVLKGWKSENGFKGGYLKVLENAMLQADPKTDLKADPHINSKLHVWKKSYTTISTMLSVRGFRWNDSSHTIDVQSDDILDNFVKADANARIMRYKAWPFYKDWCEIFGKDRVTGGEDTDAFADDVQNGIPENENLRVDQIMHNTDVENNDEKSEDRGTEENIEAFVDGVQEILNGTPENENLQEDQLMHNTGEENIADDGGSSAASQKTNSGVKKRKERTTAANTDDSLLEIIARFCEKIDRRLGELAKRVGAEYDASVSRRAVFGALDGMSFLSDEYKILVARQLCADNKDLDLFFSLPERMRVKMVKMKLGAGASDTCRNVQLL